jgi:hypothetical protein
MIKTRAGFKYMAAIGKMGGYLDSLYPDEIKSGRCATIILNLEREGCAITRTNRIQDFSRFFTPLVVPSPSHAGSST